MICVKKNKEHIFLFLPNCTSIPALFSTSERRNCASWYRLVLCKQWQSAFLVNVSLFKRWSSVVGRHCYREEHLSDSFTFYYRKYDSWCTLKQKTPDHLWWEIRKLTNMFVWNRWLVFTEKCYMLHTKINLIPSQMR